MIAFLKYLDARMGEPSTWGAVAALLTVLHVNISSDTWAALTTWLAVGSGLLGIILADQGKGTTQIAQDILNALIALTNKKEPKA